jgi:hypothetical protein
MNPSHPVPVQTELQYVSSKSISIRKLTHWHTLGLQNVQMLDDVHYFVSHETSPGECLEHLLIGKHTVCLYRNSVIIFGHVSESLN